MTIKNPKRPTDPNPMFAMNDTYVIKGQSSLQQQRTSDGTPHTRGGRYQLHPGLVEPVGDTKIDLYLNKSVEAPKARLDPDTVVKSFLNKAQEVEEADSTGPKLSVPAGKQKVNTSGAKAAGNAVGGVIKTAAGMVGKVASAVAGVVPTSGR